MPNESLVRIYRPRPIIGPLNYLTVWIDGVERGEPWGKQVRRATGTIRFTVSGRPVKRPMELEERWNVSAVPRL